METPQVIFTPWNKKHFEQIYKILQVSWRTAFSSFIPEEDLTSYLNQTYNKRKMNELFINENVFCFVAEIEGSAVGWLRLTIDEVENKFYVSSMYVLPKYQKLKIGGRFMEIAFSAAKEKGFSEIWIGVMEKNIIALRWYEKAGFLFEEKHPFIMGKTEVQHFIGRKKLL